MTDQAQSTHDDDEAGIHRASCTPRALALHLASEHADVAAMDRTLIFNEGMHHHQHTASCTALDHAEDDFSWDREKVRALTGEAEGDGRQETEDPPGRTPDKAETARPEPADDAGRERALTERIRDYAPTGNLRETPPDGLGYLADPEEHDLSWYRARVNEAVARAQDDDREADAALNLHMAVHLASAHDDGGAWYRDLEGNEAAHRDVRPRLHRHTVTQHRYERALAEKIEADAGDGTLVSWSPVPHPPHEVLDMARAIAGMHEHDPGMSPGMMAVDLAWIKTGGWPWHRRLLAGALLAFCVKRPPSGCLGRRTGGAGG